MIFIRLLILQLAANNTLNSIQQQHQQQFQQATTNVSTSSQQIQFIQSTAKRAKINRFAAGIQFKRRRFINYAKAEMLTMQMKLEQKALSARDTNIFIFIHHATQQIYHETEPIFIL